MCSLCCSLSLGIVAFVLGIVATQRGLGLAVDLGAGIITPLSLHNRLARGAMKENTPSGNAWYSDALA
jgi:hypothetical protein